MKHQHEWTINEQDAGDSYDDAELLCVCGAVWFRCVTIGADSHITQSTYIFADGTQVESTLAVPEGRAA